MTAREYLEQALSIDMKIESCRLEAVACRELAEKLTPFLTGKDCPAARSIRRLEEAEEKASSEAAALADQKGEILEAIRSVPDSFDRRILLYRYMGAMTWRQIGKKLLVDESTVRHRHDRALQTINPQMSLDVRGQSW